MAKRMLKDERIAVLAGLALFESCTKKDLGRIAAISIEVERSAGTLLTREGQGGGVMFVIVDGQAEVVRAGRVLSRLGPGDVVGELSLIDGQARSASVRAVTDVRLLEIVHDDFVRLVQHSPRFVQNLLRALSIRVRETDDLTS